MLSGSALSRHNLWCQPFGAGYHLVPIGRRSKVPRDKGWQTKAYSKADLVKWLGTGGNLGVLLGDEDLILDIDPRHGGIESLTRLGGDLHIDFSAVPTVLSGRGDGGKHIYYKKHAGLRVRGHVEGYPGIDIKTKGGFVLAPGSRHPNTGGLYRPDPGAPSITEVSGAPTALLEALRRPNARPRVAVGGGELSSEELEVLLAALDPAQYGAGQYERWFRFAAACHDATNGEGLGVWLEWAARDPGYGSAVDDERNTVMWNSLKAGKAGGVSYLHLLGELARAGALELALRVEPNFTFEPYRGAVGSTSSSGVDPFEESGVPIVDTVESRRTARVVEDIPGMKEARRG